MSDLHALVARWRGFAGNRKHERWNELQADTYRACADELAAALAKTGWRSMDDCPSDFRLIWVWSDGQVRSAKADGEHCRWCLQEGLKRTPTMWHPCELPPPPAEEPPR